MLAATSFDRSIILYENLDGTGTFANGRVISANPEYYDSVHAADVDNDGDVDVFSAFSGKIVWHSNTDKKASFTDEAVITPDASSPRLLHAADIDGDGDVDVLSAYSDSIGGKIDWYENTDGKGMSWTQRDITSHARSVYPADLDGDGDLDVLSASNYVDNKIIWYENTDGRGTFGSPRIIPTEAAEIWSLYAADMDGDGDIDVLSISASSYANIHIEWYENTDGKGSFGPQHVVTSEVFGIRWVYAADVDRDGDVDVFSALRDNTAWYENIDGRGTFGTQHVITSEATINRLVDVDGDGDIDMFAVAHSDGKVVWYENNGQGHLVLNSRPSITRQYFGVK